MPHQEEGIMFLEKTNGRAMLADQMGLGKTRTTIEYLRRNNIKATVITTKSFLYGWKAEIERWAPGAQVSVVDKKSAAFLITDDFILTTYDLIWRSNTDFVPRLDDCIVFDESHKIANPESKRSQAARRMAAGRKHVILLTGTPQPAGQPRQLWHQMLLVFPRFMKWSEFAKKFCRPTQVWAPWAGRFGRHVWDYSGSSDEEELRALIAPRFLRRTKEILNLPPLTTEYVPVPVKTARKAGEEWTAYAARLASDTTKHTIALVDDVLERGGKVIVFTSFKAVRDAVYAAFCDKAVRVTAEMDANARGQLVKSFQENPNDRVFVATTQIASEALTLTAANTIIFSDMPFVPGLLDQAIARGHRKGQERPVHVYYMQTDTTFARVVRRRLEERKEVTKKVLDEEAA